MVDAVDKLFDSMVLVYGVSYAVIFVIMVIAFKSIFAPIRLLLEVALIFIFFFGINTLIF